MRRSGVCLLRFGDGDWLWVRPWGWVWAWACHFEVVGRGNPVEMGEETACQETEVEVAVVEVRRDGGDDDGEDEDAAPYSCE